MNKLYFLLPIAAWIGCYFVWGYSEYFFVHGNHAVQMWWALTDIFSGVAVLCLFMLAIYENDL